MIQQVSEAFSDTTDQGKVENILLGILQYLESFRDNLKDDATPSATLSRRKRGILAELANQIQSVIDEIDRILAANP